MSLRSVQNKMQESILSEIEKVHHDQQSSGPETKRPANEIIINRGITYYLRNGRFSRVFSHDKVILEKF